MKMLIHLFNPESERRDGQETGAGSARKEFAEVKADLVFTGHDSRSADHGMVKLTIGAKSPLRDSHGRGFNAPNLDTQALRRTPACDINCMNGYSADHVFSRPLAPCPLGLGA